MESHIWRKHLVTSTEAKDLYFNDKPRYVTFTHMGIPYWSLETHSYDPDLNAVSLICEDCEQISMHHSRPSRWGNVVQGHEFKQHNSLIFVNCVEFNYSRALYNPNVPKCPLKVKVSHCNRSGPHVTSQVALMSPGREEEPLVTRLLTTSFVNATTRLLAAAPPKFYTDELDGKETGSHGLRVKRLPKRPANSYMRKVMILLSHCDRNDHANFAIYLTLCLETLQHALTSKKVWNTSTRKKRDTGSDDSALAGSSSGERDAGPRILQPRWLTSEAVKHGVKTARLRYLGEAVAGEELCVYLWQEEDKPRWVFFSMESENPARPAARFEMSLEYYGPPARM